MDTVSPVRENNDTRRSSSPNGSTSGEKHQLGSEHVQIGSMEIRIAGSDSTDIGQLEPLPKDATKNSIRSLHKKNRVSLRARKRKYMLRSSVGSARVLRSSSRGPSKAPVPPNSLVNVSAEKKKKRKKRKTIRTLDDEFSRTRKRLRYLLTRMSYEKSLIDAYSGEGWKGQSSEKIKPEKELQRATSEILRCKLKIRDLFQHLNSLCAEGRFPESLFDSEGQIYSEDIFCAKCGLKDLSTDNDIVLCDGICNRGFHQMCLEPPLLKEEIPPGDEGWLCPGCDCKVDCIDLLNDFQETDLSIDDHWEKVFPEAAAAAAGDKQVNYLGLPSDDSEDDDYDPDGPQVDGKVQTEDSSSDESDFTSESDDSRASPNNEQYLGLPSDDSDDDDYDPTVPDLDEQVNRESSRSDFTSDCENLSASSDDDRPSVAVEVPVSFSMEGVKPLAGSGKRSTIDRKKQQSTNSELLSLLEPDLGQDNATLVLGKRNHERLDYKKLHDETYGNVPSDSSDDEDWTEIDALRKGKSDVKNSFISPKINSSTSKSGIKTKDIKQNLEENENTPKRTRQKLNFEGANNSVANMHGDCLELGSSGNKAAASPSRSLGKAVTQKLYESFRQNEYPNRATKENMVKELGITLRQVSKWFENARRSLRQSAKVGVGKAETTSPNKVIILTQSKGKALEPEMITKDIFDHTTGTALTLDTEGCNGNVERRKLVTGESSQQKSMTHKSRKRRNCQIDEQTSDANKTPVKDTTGESPKGQAAPIHDHNANQEVTRSNIKTRRRKSVA